MDENELRELFKATNTSEPLSEGWPGLLRFGLAVAAAEREACAKNVRGAWVVNLLHVVLLGASVFGAIVAWGWFGPFAGAMWSGGCFTFGVMFGMTLGRQAPNAEFSGTGERSLTGERR